MKATQIKNAVIFKEVTLTMKKPKLVIELTVVNALLTFVALIIVGSFSLSAAMLETVPYVAILLVFLGLVCVEACMVAFLVPALTAGTISGERERQTLEVLLTTKMTTWQIIKGKYFSAILSVLLVIISALPFMSLVFIYGGISMWQMLLIALTIIIGAMYVAAFGVFFSALTKRTIFATVLTYMVLILIIIGTIGLVGTIYMIVEIVNDVIYYQSNYNLPSDLLSAGFSCFLLYWNPAVTIFDAIGHIIGYGFEGTGTMNGMADLIGGISISGISSKNLLLRFWTPISIVVQMLTAYGILRWAAALLNPTRGSKRRMKRMRKVIEKREQEQAQAQQQ